MKSSPAVKAMFVEEPDAVMRIHGQGNVPLRSVVQFMTSVDRIHRRFQAFDTLFILIKQGYRLPERVHRDPKAFAYLIKRAEVKLTLPRLHSVELHSPGFWEVLGSLSPPNFIKDLLQQRHERKKDISYRNEAEATRLWLENEMKANEIVKQRIDILRSAGATDEKLRRHFVRPILSSAKHLSIVSDRRVIDPTQVSVRKRGLTEKPPNQAL